MLKIKSTIKVLFQILILIGLIVLFSPMKNVYKDGGTKEYKALAYRVVKYHKLDDNSENGFFEGYRIDIFGTKVYDSLDNSPESTL